MDRHGGVSCDACNASQFRGRRYKCLRCMDYDLCENCYSRGLISGEHMPDHAVQCILTPADFEAIVDESNGARELCLHEIRDGNITAVSFTCPYCAEMGFSVQYFLDHLRANHAHNEEVVICPMCAASRDSNNQVDDLASHIAADHIGSGDFDGSARAGVQARARGVRTRRAKQTARRGGVPRGYANSGTHSVGTNVGVGGFLDAARMDENMETINELINQLSDPSRIADGGGDSLIAAPPSGDTLRVATNQSNRPRMPFAVSLYHPPADILDNQSRVRARHNAGGGTAASGSTGNEYSAAATGIAALQDMLRPSATSSVEQLQRFQGLMRELERDGSLADAAENWSSSNVWPSLLESSTLPAAEAELLANRAWMPNTQNRTSAGAVDVPDALGGFEPTGTVPVGASRSSAADSVQDGSPTANNNISWATVAEGEVLPAMQQKRSENVERLSLLARIINTEEMVADQMFSRQELANRVLFVQQLLIAALRDGASFAAADDDYVTPDRYERERNVQDQSKNNGGSFEGDLPRNVIDGAGSSVQPPPVPPASAHTDAGADVLNNNVSGALPWQGLLTAAPSSVILPTSMVKDGNCDADDSTTKHDENSASVSGSTSNLQLLQQQVDREETASVDSTQAATYGSVSERSPSELSLDSSMGGDDVLMMAAQRSTSSFVTPYPITVGSSSSLKKAGGNIHHSAVDVSGSGGGRTNTRYVPSPRSVFAMPSTVSGMNDAAHGRRRLPLQASAPQLDALMPAAVSDLTTADGLAPLTAIDIDATTTGDVELEVGSIANVPAPPAGVLP